MRHVRRPRKHREAERQLAMESSCALKADSVAATNAGITRDDLATTWGAD
jgi:hypothetical protein